jgi:protoporphyrin/coproporphyrin ferrochelatase
VSSDATPYDALLLVSFGGPEEPGDVLPFLQNVTRGRGIPADRLLEVGQHYLDLGGVSPINAQNRALIAAIEDDFAANALRLPVYWGNRNWDPYLTDAMARLADDGARRVLALFTSAYSSYSGCRQYRENLAAAAAPLGARAPHVDRVRHYFNHPGFVETMVATTLEALARVPEGSHLLFVTHSIPEVMNEGSGPLGGAYVAQHRDVARLVAEGVAAVIERDPAFDLAYCSRSGQAHQPWLEPDVNDHLEVLSALRVPGVVLVPIGFVSDHMEVKYDLDTEAMRTADRLELPCARAGTVGTDPRFVSAIRELVLERAALVRGESIVRRSLGELGPSHDICPVGCCPNLRDATRPALCGAG